MELEARKVCKRHLFCVKFLKKEINFGGTSPHKTLRIWRNGKGKCEDVWLDEQIIVDGKVFHINENIIDDNLNKLLYKLLNAPEPRTQIINYFKIVANPEPK